MGTWAGLNRSVSLGTDRRLPAAFGGHIIGWGPTARNTYEPA